MTASAAPRASLLLRQLLPLTIVVMEFAWAYPWLLLLSGVFYRTSVVPLLPAVTTLALAVLGYLVARATSGRSWSLRATRVLVVASGVISGMTAVRLTYYPGRGVLDLRWIGALLVAAHDALPAVTPAVTGALTATVVWWRGVILAEREFGYFEADRAFRRGIGWTVAFVLLLAVYEDARGFALTSPVPLYLLAFFAVGLMTLSVTRLLTWWEEPQADPAQVLAANRHWLVLLAALLGVIVSLAAVLATALRVGMRPELLRLLRPLAPVAEAVFYVLFAVAIVVARVIVYVLARLPFRRMLPPAAEATPPAFRDLLKDLSPQLVSSARWGMVALGIVVLAALVAISVARARRKKRTGRDDERESVWSSQAVLGAVGDAWRRLWNRPRPAARVREGPAVGAIRAIYRELLRLGASAGSPRAPHQTPHEYRTILVGRMPEPAGDIGILTEMYERVRYSPHRPEPEDVDGAQQALARIKTSVAP